jgi:protein SCO1/2
MPAPAPKPPTTAPATEGLTRTFAASLLALLLTLVVVFVATNQGQAFTTEALRRSEVARAPQPIPDFSMLNGAGRPTTLHQLLASGERVWVVDFFYTRCQTVCSVLGAVYQQLQRQVEARGLQGQVGLLSVSFDPVHDDVPALQAYAARMDANPAVWDIVSLAGISDRRRLLDAFGIMVVPAPLGEFEHNAALLIVNARGQLVRILDYDSTDQVLDVALASRL